MSLISWKEVLDWKEEEIDDLRTVGYSYLQQGCFDIALTFFNALVTLNPESTYDIQTLGALYLQKGNHLLALNYIEQALKFDPHHLPTLLNRCKTLYALGYYRQAKAQTEALKSSADPYYSNQAEALLLAHS